jgi:hypothetical protein
VAPSFRLSASASALLIRLILVSVPSSWTTWRANGSTAAQPETSPVTEAPLRGPEQAAVRANAIATLDTAAQRHHGWILMMSIPLQ